MVKITWTKKKLQALAIVGMVSTTLFISGTFAWQSIRQQVSNKFNGEVNPGARLHDDFNGNNKDIYVENFTDPHNGANVYARIQLKEYMEIGADAGEVSTETTRTNRDVTVIGKEDADIQDVNTWHTHKMDIDTTEAVAFHDYWTWTMGNEDTNVKKYYMPTFNKDNTSLEADVNGTLEGIDGDRKTGVPYDDYQEWTSTSTKSEIEHLNGRAQSDAAVEHTAKEVKYHAKVISMRQWKEEGKKPGPYWVYDRDGWAYWAQAIAPGETTGLLLDKVDMTKTPEDNYYYVIHAIGEFATAGDWTGFDGNITEEGKDLLNTISNCLPEVIYMAPKNGYEQVAVIGTNLTLEVNMNIKNGTGDPLESAVEWKIDDTSLAYTIDGNVFTPVEEMVGKSYKLTATSKLTPSVTTTITVTVLPSGLDDSDSVEGADKQRYINFGNNVYKRIEEDGSLSDFICAGKDKIIGNSDDKTNVYDVVPALGGAHPQYGRFFLPQGTNRYQAMGPDNMLGTSDDIIVTSLTNKWPMNMSDILANKVKIVPADGSAAENIEVKIGQTKQFRAEVYLSNELISNQKVTWSISGQKSTQTSISENGNLTVGLDEPENTYINIRAVSKEDPTHAANYITVKVSALGYEDIPTVEVESSTTVKIGDVDYYVMENDGEKALLWAKTKINLNRISSVSNQNQSWESVELRTQLNEEWLNSQPDVLKENIIETTIYSSYGKPTTYDSHHYGQSIAITEDKVFLLSLEDFKPHPNVDVRLQTAGRTLHLDNIDSDSGIKWLRSMFNGSLYGKDLTIAYYLTESRLSYEGVSETGNVYPAFWIKLPDGTKR